jgi:hypothetical protein
VHYTRHFLDLTQDKALALVSDIVFGDSSETKFDSYGLHAVIVAHGLVSGGNAESVGKARRLIAGHASNLAIQRVDEVFPALCSLLSTHRSLLSALHSPLSSHCPLLFQVILVVCKCALLRLAHDQPEDFLLGNNGVMHVSSFLR